MAEYHLNTLWRIAAPLHPVFNAVFDSLRWPEWWPGSEHVEEIDAGAPDGVGSIRRYAWKGRLPYRLSFDACATRLEPPRLLEAIVKGDLEGMGRWAFAHQDGITSVQYEWHVHTTKRWMNLVAPLGHHVLANNHHALMDSGAQALAQLLNARLVESRAITDAELVYRLPVNYR